MLRLLGACLAAWTALLAGASAPTMGADPCGLPSEALSAGAQPPPCWRPYGPSSPFNRPIPPDPPLLGNSASVVRRLLGFGHIQNLIAGTAGRGELDGGRPLYYSTPSDPTVKLHCTEDWGRCALEGAVVHLPDAARPGGGSDAHLTVIDQSSGWEYDLWGVWSKPTRGGVLPFRWGGKTRIDGDGLGSDATAARYGTAAGLLRAEELAAGEINHALFLGVKCDSGRHIFPASKHATPCSDLGLSNANAPAEGSRFQLAMSDDQINALAVPDWKKTILRAMAHYGMIVGDTGGSWGLQWDSGVAYTSFGQPDRWVGLAQAWHLPYFAGDRDYIFDLSSGVDWGRYLRVLSPCVSSGSCPEGVAAANRAGTRLAARTRGHLRSRARATRPRTPGSSAQPRPRR